LLQHLELLEHALLSLLDGAERERQALELRLGIRLS
jgi:hypothetical protein